MLKGQMNIGRMLWVFGKMGVFNSHYHPNMYQLDNFTRKFMEQQGVRPLALATDISVRDVKTVKGMRKYLSNPENKNYQSDQMDIELEHMLDCTLI